LTSRLSLYRLLYRSSREESMARSEDITNITEHRRNLREHLRQVRETGRPLYVTNHGQTEAIVLSPEAYDALADRAELAESFERLEDRLEDVEAGRKRPGQPVLERIADELGLPRDR